MDTAKTTPTIQTQEGFCQAPCFSADTRARTQALIKSDEGCAKRIPDGRLKAYLDSRGIWTIGYGFNLQAGGLSPALAAKTIWTQAQAEESFESCFNRCVASLDKNFPRWTELAPARQAVAVSAMYQMGAGKVAQFVQTIQHIMAHEYEDAAAHMEASAWGRQTPKRVKRLAQMMRTGAWV